MALQRREKHNGHVMSSTVTDYLLSRLSELGVRHVFGVPGDFNLTMLDAVEAHPNLTWVGTANEQGAAYAADGSARMNGFGAVMTTFGVGELSALNAIAGAYAENVPVVNIVGAPSTRVQNAGSFVHHTLADGDFNRFGRMAAEITSAQTHLRVEGAAQEIDRVLRVADRFRLPVHITIPSDVAQAPIPAPRNSLRLERTSDPASLAAFLANARTLITNAKSVSLLAGHLVDRFDARNELRHLVNDGDLPVAVLSMAKGLVDETDRHFVGLYAGSMSDDTARRRIENADVIITAGVLLTDSTTAGFSHRLDLQRRIDISPEAANIAGATYERVLMRDAIAGLARIFSETREPHILAPHRNGIAAGLISAVKAEEPKSGGMLTQEAFWARFQRYLRPGDIVFADQGTSFYGALEVALPRGAAIVGQPHWAAIGWTLPAMMGAQLADPSRRMILVIGDGAAQQTVQELGTMLRLGLKPLIIVLNNNGYTIERAIHSPESKYHDISAWNWLALPSALGGEGKARVLHALTPGELDRAFSTACPCANELILMEVRLGAMDRPKLLDRFAEALAAQNAPSQAVA